MVPPRYPNDFRMKENSRWTLFMIPFQSVMILSRIRGWMRRWTWICEEASRRDVNRPMNGHGSVWTGLDELGWAWTALWKGLRMYEDVVDVSMSLSLWVSQCDCVCSVPWGGHVEISQSPPRITDFYMRNQLQLRPISSYILEITWNLKFK